MASNQRELSIVISAKDNASSKIASLGDKMSASFGKVSLAAGVVGGAVAAFAASSVKNFMDAERSSRQLEHAVIAVSKGTQEQVDAIEDLTAALQKKAGIDGDALTMGAAQLSTFGLQTDSVIKLTKSLADLTVNQSGLEAGAEDYIGSANVMAKALQGQFGALEKSGIRFTEAQQSLILYGSETEKVAALQEGLAQNLRETTDTIGNTTEAMFAKLKQSLGDVQEALGQALLPAINATLDKLLPLVQMVSDWATKNPQLVAAILTATIAVTGFLAALGPLGTVIELVGLALANWPVALFVAAVIALGVVLVAIRDQVTEFYNKLQETGAIDRIKASLVSVIDKVKELWEQFKQTGILDALKNAIMLVVDAFVESLWPAIQQIWLALQPWMPLFGAIAQVIGVIVIGALLLFIVTVATAIQIIGGIIGKIAEFAGKISNDLKPAIDFAVGFFNNMVNSIKELVGWFNNAISAIERFLAAASKVSGSITGGVLNAITGGSKKRALGGPVTAGRSYLVGERGPELFTAPSGGGTITPTNRLAGGGVSVGVSINVGSVASDVDVRRMAQQVGDIILGKLQSNMGI